MSAKTPKVRALGVSLFLCAGLVSTGLTQGQPAVSHDSVQAFRGYLGAQFTAIDAEACTGLASVEGPRAAIGARRASLICDGARVTVTEERLTPRWYAPFLPRWRVEGVTQHQVVGLGSPATPAEEVENGDTEPSRPRSPATPLILISDTNVTARAMRLRSRGYVAIGLRDLDGDGRDELVLVDEGAHVEVYRKTGNRLARVARRELPATPRAVPRRRIFGTTAPHPNGLIIELSSRPFSFLAQMDEGALELRMDETDCPPGAHLLGDVCARPVDGRDYFASTLEPREGAAAPRRAQGSFYQRRHGEFGAAEDRVAVEAIVTPHGRLAVVVGERPSGVMGHGAALALADLDRDGGAEILTSSAAEQGQGDHLMITRARRDGVILSVWRSGGVGGSVLLADAGDLDGDGAAAFVAIEEPRGGGRARAWVVSCCESRE